MLLPLFFIFFGAILWPKGTRVRQSLTLFLAFVFVIAPLTIRNFVVFHAFVPISSAGGHNFIAGLADYDAEGKFGLSVLDVDAAKQEAEMYGRPDYGVNQYSPDGIQREKDRYRRGIKIVIENPVWYFRSVIHRALTYSLRFERVPVIAPERDERANTIPILYILNIPLKAFQRLFITAILTPLMLGGIIILFRRKEKRKVLLVLLIVPVYYACIQSLLHTEYRYVLPATHVVIMFSAVALSYLLGMVLKLLAKTPDTNNPQINAD